MLLKQQNHKTLALGPLYLTPGREYIELAVYMFNMLEYESENDLGFDISDF